MHKNSKNYLINEKIGLPWNEQVRLIHGDTKEMMTFSEAKKRASEEGLDLIAVNLSVKPSILMMHDFFKYLYEIEKKDKASKHSQKPLKEINIRTNIAENDLLTKVNHAKEFIQKGSKVKVTLTMKGRELSRREESKKAIMTFIDMSKEFSKVESFREEGNKSIVFLVRK